ncbi:hypothetical protein IWX50DRAFT_78776 [Phyllosticta citricarpa]|uniref:Uncharacterized protein n=1 Tax=Phyllosticta citricarpa TaxID=55181 RepID=A0ABR1MD37_9PEZI
MAGWLAGQHACWMVCLEVVLEKDVYVVCLFPFAVWMCCRLFFFFFFFFFQKEISLPFRSVLNVLSSGFSSDLVHCFVYIFIVSGSLPFPKIFLGVVALTKPPNLNHILTPLSRPE